MSKGAWISAGVVALVIFGGLWFSSKFGIQV